MPSNAVVESSINALGRLISPRIGAAGAAGLARFRPMIRHRRLDPDMLRGPVVLGRLGSLEARLAVTSDEVKQAQALRYKVFYEEMGAQASALTRLTRRDADRFDRFTDHVLVVDHDAPEVLSFGRVRPKVVATYRLLRQERAPRRAGFYTASEFEIGSLVERNPGLNFLELGRSCVLPAWRGKRSIELLWTAIWAYVQRHKIDAMFGCASFPGADPAEHKAALGFLGRQAGAPAEWRVSANADRKVAMDPVELTAGETKRVLVGLPPLIKGYLRLGAYVGDGAVVDRQFATTDVLMVLPVSRIDPRYIAYFS